jgi:glycosyltransferase involved in cell wall biosynthesis
MKKLLFIYSHPFGASYGGSLVTERAYSAFLQKYTVIKYFVDKSKNNLLSLFRNLFLFPSKLSLFDLIKVDKLLKTNTDINIVFLDVSLFGRIARMVKKKYPNIKVIINFHNNEGQFFYDRIKICGWKYLPLWLSALYNERLSCHNSDLNIFLTEEDRKSINTKSVPSIIIPVTLVDSYNHVKPQAVITEQNYILFIGIAYYANLHGAQFLIKEIAPYVSCNIVIAGKGMQTALSNIRSPENVIIKDYIDDLSGIYYGASVFIAPLFYGSGMKVKIAEAMMHGKKIIATPLAFYGYKPDSSSCAICDTAEEFITGINESELTKTFYEESRQLYLKYYSASNNGLYYSRMDKFL